MPMTDNERQRILGLKQTADARIAAIRADGNLSDQGKREAMAAVYAPLKHQLQAIRDGIAERDQKRKVELERKLFGLPANALSVDVIGYRDALDRAAGLENYEQAAALLDRAESSGDTQLARAIFAHAYESGGPGNTGWNRIVEDYLDRHPETVDTVAELINVTPNGERSAHFEQSMLYNVPTPSELQGHLTFSGELKPQTPAAAGA